MMIPVPPTARLVVAASLLSAYLAPSPARAQAAGVPIEPQRIPAPTADLNAQLSKLRDAGQLMSADAVAAALRHPTPTPVALAPTATVPLSPPEVAARARRSFLRVAWCFPGRRPGTWDINVADGYLLTADGVAGTAYHVLRPPRQLHRQPYLYAQTPDGRAYPVTQVLAADPRMDTALIRLGGAAGLTPMGINDQTAPGDAVYLLSDPSWVSGYFSTGVINRFYWDAGKLRGDPMNIDDVRSLRMDVSANWSPGSSGAAVVDACGNVVAHVSKISTLNGPMADRPGGPTTRDADPPLATYIPLHEAAPVRGLRLLVDDMNRRAPATTQPR